MRISEEEVSGRVRLLEVVRWGDRNIDMQKFVDLTIHLHEFES